MLQRPMGVDAHHGVPMVASGVLWRKRFAVNRVPARRHQLLVKGLALRNLVYRHCFSDQAGQGCEGSMFA